jgi:hypothetical protein
VTAVQLPNPSILRFLAGLATFHPLLSSASTLAGEADALAAPDGLNFFTGVSVAQAEFIGSLGMDFDNSAAEVDAYSFELSAFLSKPIGLFAGYSMLPYFQYEANFLRPEGIPAGIPLDDEDLHEIDLSLFIYKMESGSPWITGAWINPSLSTDFESVSGDDFFLDLAVAAGYRVSDTLILGAGIGALNLTGDTAVYPGIGFSWSPTEDLYFTLYGPNFRAGWEVTDSWRLGFEVRPNGGIWNIDTAGGTRNIEFSSFRVGLGSSHRLTEKLWLSYGGGVTIGNSLNIANTDGSDLYKNTLDDLDEGYYGFVSLSLKAW